MRCIWCWGAGVGGDREAAQANTPSPGPLWRRVKGGSQSKTWNARMFLGASVLQIRVARPFAGRAWNPVILQGRTCQRPSSMAAAAASVCSWMRFNRCSNACMTALYLTRQEHKHQLGSSFAIIEQGGKIHTTHLTLSGRSATASSAASLAPAISFRLHRSSACRYMSGFAAKPVITTVLNVNSKATWFGGNANVSCF